MVPLLFYPFLNLAAGGQAREQKKWEQEKEEQEKEEQEKEEQEKERMNGEEDHPRLN
jgi:hypothetical protein